MFVRRWTGLSNAKNTHLRTGSGPTGRPTRARSAPGRLGFARRWAGEPQSPRRVTAGSIAAARRREHKWGLALETLHYALSQGTIEGEGR